MVFSSIAFLYIFLPLTLMSYFFVPYKFKKFVLLASGLLFYSWGEPIYIVVMVISTLIDYLAGRFIDYYDGNKRARLIFLLISIFMNIGLLAFFKYSNFIIENINFLFGFDISSTSIALPIGISFYTFQSMSYTIDLYMRKIKVQKDPIKFTSFVTLFPQIVAGPIVRYSDVEKDIDFLHTNEFKISNGICIFVIGLAKKVLLANNIGSLWATIKELPYSELTVVTAWLGILAFTFQIYFDFSGYSDMAIGLGKILGFSFPKNFNYPYLSKSVSEFWRRWHITLGNWFKSYVYFPLGGNRGSVFKVIINLLIVWGITGFWHGASWNFLIWGLYFGVIIVIEKFFLGKFLLKIPKFFSWLYTFLLVVFGWLIFEVGDLNKIFSYFKVMIGIEGNGFLDNNSWYYISMYLIIFLICAVCSTNLFSKMYKGMKLLYPKSIKLITPLFIFVFIILSTAYLVNATYNPFLYYRF